MFLLALPIFYKPYPKYKIYSLVDQPSQIIKKKKQFRQKKILGESLFCALDFLILSA